jgi:hypothetical protein
LSKSYWDQLEVSFTAKLINYSNRLNAQKNEKKGFGKQLAVVDEKVEGQENK